ncbi:membrane-anchored mycosin MYCP [Kibdelosporangium banguiense]|uniref:Membrane-anchored mycosin MYCP n=1 Tax=Kibdelosporangium banguiense TaxID=1365924 RepID=A0ABS4TDT1_9PSEU|nr:type VII secretion-associated serine protease mycosin [Kibdelosporangium banguiense]MBP2322506.1 membrane-anchored mycosin MYCP [Kibdelosporangium banguiense]
MRTTRKLTRLAAMTAAASLLIAQPAPAQPTQQQPGSGAVPPPVDMSLPLVTDTEKPPTDVKYEPKTDCVASLSDGKVVLPNKPWGQQRLQIEEAQKFATGKGQLVAVIDTGVRPHPFFQGRVVKGADYVAEKNDALEDCDGHGTEVAGIIAARSPNLDQVGFTGVAPDARILAIRQSSDVYKGKRAPTPDNPNPGETAAGDLNSLAQAVRHAADNPQVTVINMSVDNCRLSTYTISRPEQDLQRALHYAVQEKNKVVVASAGNQSDICTKPRNGADSNKPEFIITPPWFAEDVLSVAAVNQKGNLAAFSMQGPWVSVAGPGTDIISLDPSGNGLANLTVQKNGSKVPIQGTSFAAPYVAGLAALVRERYPELNARQVMNRIKMTAQHPAAPGGRDNLVGHGMVNPLAALTAMIPGEFGIPADKAEAMPAGMPPVRAKDWTAMTVALIGTGGGVLLLLMTLFIMRAIRRNNPREEAEQS